jgi:hypothetical protein
MACLKPARRVHGSKEAARVASGDTAPQKSWNAHGILAQGLAVHTVQHFPKKTLHGNQVIGDESQLLQYAQVDILGLFWFGHCCVSPVPLVARAIRGGMWRVSPVLATEKPASAFQNDCRAAAG